MDMRGLAHFIQDIRKATRSLAEEKKRVDFELAKIRLKFLEAAKMSTYDRKKYVCKLMFIAMLGYRVEFGHIEGVKLLALASPAEKLIGYLSLTVFLYEGHPLLTLATHMIYKDLLSAEEGNISLALTVIANTGGKDFSEVMSAGVKNIFLSDRWDAHIRKKAALTYLRMYRKYSDVTDLADVVPIATKLVLSPLLGLCGCAIVFLAGCFSEKNSHLFQSTPYQVVELLERIILARQTGAEYVYYGVPAPWLQAMAIRLLRKLPAPKDTTLKEKVVVLLSKIVQAVDKVLRDAQAQQKLRGTMNRVSAMNAVFFEVVLLLVEWDIDSKLCTECLDVIRSFVIEKKDSNLRYLGFTLLSRLSSAVHLQYDYKSYIKEHQPQIVVALHDPDVSICTKALDITLNTCDAENVTVVIGELLSYLPIANGLFREKLVLAVARLAEMYCSDYGWYVETIISVIAQAGSFTPHNIVYRVVDVIINHSYVQKRAALRLFSLLKSYKTVPEVLLRLAVVVLGEFGYQIALNPESTPLLQVAVLKSHMNDASEETQSLMLSTFVKLYNYYDVGVREKILKTLMAYRSSFNVELEQRAREYVGLIELGNDELLQEVLGPLPAAKGEGFFAVHNAGTAHVEVADKAPIMNEALSGSFLTGLPAFDSDASSKFVCSEENVSLDAMFYVASPLQLEHMAKENELIRQRFISVFFGSSSILYSDEAVELLCEQQYREASARVTITVQSKETTGSRKVLVEIIGVDAGLLLQSRNESGDLAAGKSLQLEFVARSCAPYKEAPTIRLSHTGSEDHATVMKVLALPIMTTKFLSPYDENVESAYNSLCKQLDSALADTRHLAAGCFSSKDTVEHALTAMGFGIFYTANSNVLKGVAAHATQTYGTLDYCPVLLDVIFFDDGASAVKVTALSSVLRTVIADILEQIAPFIEQTSCGSIQLFAC